LKIDYETNFYYYIGTMNLNIEVNKKFFTHLKPHSITVLLYSMAHYEKYSKVPSMKYMAAELKIGYYTIRKSLSEIFLFLKNDVDVDTILYNKYSFILSKSERISSTYTSYVNKEDETEVIWGRLIEVAKDYYSGSIKSYSKYYWRTGVQLKGLLEEIGYENLQKYIDWYFRVKAPRISYFNATVFCHNNIVTDFKADHKMVKTQQIEQEKGYEEESKEEEKLIFQKLIERRDAGTLDEYDKELLEYYKNQGWLND